MTGDVLPIAQRVWAEPQTPRKRGFRSKKSSTSKRTGVRRPRRTPEPSHVLVFDTETTADEFLSLTFGSWRYYRIDPDGPVCVSEGLLYADDLESTDPTGYATLCEYARTHRAASERDRPLEMLNRTEFVEKVLYRASYKARARVVGFNLPFDGSRLALDVTESRGGDGYGGFSFILWRGSGAHKERKQRPRWIVKSLATKGAFMSWSKPMSPDDDDLIPEDADDGLPDPEYAWRGRFVDCATLAFALTGEAYSLERACAAFGVEGKAEVEGHGKITAEYIDYNRQDVAATARLYAALMTELGRHPINLPPEKAYSPASLSKAYLAAMSIASLLDRHPDFRRDVLGFAMSAFFGGRAECRLRRVPVPVALVDFTSMYPTVDALMDLHRLQLAKSIEVEECGPWLRELLSSVQLTDCFDPALWPSLVGFALVAPDGDVLPVRAAFDGKTFGIGVNPVTSSEPLWYTFADCVASTLLTGKPPTIMRAIRLVPRGVIAVRVIKVRGTLEVDPSVGDPMAAMVEERQRVRRSALPKLERDRLSAALKLLVNAGSYGIYSEVNPRDRHKGVTEPVTVHGRKDEPFVNRVEAPEDPGRYCFPPFASCITGAARLMLAMLERCITDLGGTWAFCDTDSMAIVATEDGGLLACPGGSHRMSDGIEAILALSQQDVEGIRQRFRQLNPYDPDAVPDLLKLEATEPCFAVSAKRYALHDLVDGEVVFPEDHLPSRSGLGQFLSPNPDHKGRAWIYELWRAVLRQLYGLDVPDAAWLDRPMVVRTTVTTPAVLRAFRHLNAGRDYRDQIKPFNFVVSAAGAKPPAGAPPSGQFRLVAPYETNPERWEELEFTNVHDPDATPYRITTRDGRPGFARVDSYRDILACYPGHPESKSLAPDGGPCRRMTEGLLQRRPVVVGKIVLIGKESTRIEERRSGELTIDDVDQRLTTYDDHDEWCRIWLPQLRERDLRSVAEAIDMSVRRLRDIRDGKVYPQKVHRDALIGALTRGTALNPK